MSEAAISSADSRSGPRTFHHRVFADARHLLARKRRAGVRISLGIPTLDEEHTIGPIVEMLRREFRERVPLLDQIVVIDSGSTDATLARARAAGAETFLASEILPELPPAKGKGENLWKSLHVLNGDLLCYLDGDLADIQPRFVTGLLGPLLEFPDLGYVKAFYERPPQRAGEEGFGGGRVTEILVRPLLAIFYPELAGVIQPLAGEFAARRTILQTLVYPTGYSVEISHLLELRRKHGLAALAQVDLETRLHRNRPTAELGRMAFDLLRTFLRQLRLDGRDACAVPPGDPLLQFVADEQGPASMAYHPREIERPPVADFMVTAQKKTRRSDVERGVT